MDEASVRYTNAVLIDDEQRTHIGDFLLHSDGTWSKSNGDEDVAHNLDGSKRLITRSFQNWHTHLPMQLNARDFSDGLPLEEWLDKSIFPTEMKLTKEYARIGALASALEMIKTGTTFACDMYHFPESIVSALNEVGLRGIVCGPQTQWPPREGGDDGSVRRELEAQLASNKPGDKVHYGVATHAIYTCDENTLLGGKELLRSIMRTFQFTCQRPGKEVANCFKKSGMYPVEYLDSIDFFIPEREQSALMVRGLRNPK